MAKEDKKIGNFLKGRRDKSDLTEKDLLALIYKRLSWVVIWLFIIAMGIIGISNSL